MQKIPKTILLSLTTLLTGGFVFGLGQTNSQEISSLAPVSWGDSTWHLRSDPTSGALLGIQNGNDPHQMEWLRQPGHWEKGRNWVADPVVNAGDSALTGWGLVEWKQHKLVPIEVSKTSAHSWKSIYEYQGLTVKVEREIDTNGELAERYVFTNTGTTNLCLPLGSLSITAPFFDQYPDSTVSLVSRCHTHLWMGGTSSWVNALRMGTDAPHLGLVVTQGGLDAYSQRGGMHDDRGLFLLHPSAMTLKPGENRTVAWKLFWHQGWSDFFAKLNATPGFIRMMAKDYVVSAGHPLQVSVEAATPMDSPTLLANGTSVPFKTKDGKITASIPTDKLGDLLVELESKGRKTWLRAFVIPPIDDLIEKRLKFIVRKQQRNTKGDPLDGAYLAYDNEINEQVYDAKWRDHNAGRERLAMGVLGALYLPLCKDPQFKAELTQSLVRYSDFINREMEDDQGNVFNDIGRRTNNRLYNYPWVAHFHLAMYRATGDAAHLDRFVQVMRSYYRQGGERFYAIGIPITDGLQALKEVGREAEYKELLHLFRAHADTIIKNGVHYPRFEVNFEQSIVAPAVQMLTEMYFATGDSHYIKAARVQMPLLEAFAGRQPDSRLMEISIRHWDDYWFGKRQLYGDTFPHYWSTINALTYAYYGRATGESDWIRRANAILKGNLSLFTPEGSGSAAHLYAMTINGKNGAENDPWANDQDWALVNMLMVQSLLHKPEHVGK